MKKLLCMFLASLMILPIVVMNGCAPAGGKVEPTEEPMVFSEFQWPKSEIASLIPIPESSMGHIDWEASYGFVIYVAETSKEQYDAYVNSCWEKGFTVDYRKGDDYFWADDANGYHLHLKFEGDDVMFIRMDDSDISSDSPNGEEATPGDSDMTDDTASAPTDGPNNETTDAPDDGEGDASGETVEWRKFLQKYEEWVNDYIDLIKKYKANPNDASIISEYVDMMTKLSEWSEKSDTVKVQLENDPTAQFEYLSELVRINQRLSDAMGDFNN